MKLLAIVGSYRKGKAIDFLIDKAIEGAKSNNKVEVEKVYLIDKKIEYCRNCMVCRNDDPNKTIAKCIIQDDMQEIYPLIDEADGFIFGTPVNIGTVTAVMKAFLERICWVCAKPGKRPLNGCPEPRNKKQKKAIIIVSSGIVPPFLRVFCDDATSLIKSVCDSSLNASVVGSFYAGALEKRGVNFYFGKAFNLGKKISAK